MLHVSIEPFEGCLPAQRNSCQEKKSQEIRVAGTRLRFEDI